MGDRHPHIDIIDLATSLVRFQNNIERRRIRSANTRRQAHKSRRQNPCTVPHHAALAHFRRQRLVAADRYFFSFGMHKDFGRAAIMRDPATTGIILSPQRQTLEENRR
jgi:hypothetical protein